MADSQNPESSDDEIVDADQDNVAVRALLSDDETHLSPDYKFVSHSLRQSTPEQFQQMDDAQASLEEEGDEKQRVRLAHVTALRMKTMMILCSKRGGSR
jgi:hypothetical protein